MAEEKKPGFAIDSSGNSVIDPTENVKTAMAGEKTRADDLRIAEQTFRDYQINTLKEFLNLKADNLKEIQNLHVYHDKELRVLDKEIQNLHVSYGKELKEAEKERLDDKAKLADANITVERERQANSAALLAKTVEQNADKLRGELDSFKRENNDRLVRVEQT